MSTTLNTDDGQTLLRSRSDYKKTDLETDVKALAHRAFWTMQLVALFHLLRQALFQAAIAASFQTHHNDGSTVHSLLYSLQDPKPLVLTLMYDR